MSNTRNENTFSNVLYGSPVGTSQNNCYAYAINYYVNRGDTKLQPGNLAGNMSSVDLSSCRDMRQRVQDDAKAMGWTITVIDKDTVCPKGSVKIASVIAPNIDFHWYKYHKHVMYRVKTPRSVADLAREFGVSTADVHNPNPGNRTNSSTLRLGDIVLIRNANCWSHKQGFSPEGPILKDSCGKVIKDPATACRTYGYGLNYTSICTVYCLRKQ